ncbi:hypothetical protein N9D22_05230 [Flavobacteriaceae bacterium]|nr:hypothetical protein [Flavobacteriaceae bacterium]
MKGVFDFVVMPKENRYNNTKTIEGKELILNTELQNHNFVSRIGVVMATPNPNPTGVREGDEVILHHNVFRRFRDIRGEEKNSRSYYKNNMYFVSPDQIFAYKRMVKWIPLNGFNFVKPIKEDKMFSINFEKPLVGVLKYKDPSLKEVKEGDLVGFKPGAEYEFLIDKEKLYRVPTNLITIKYEYQGNEEEYNPSWAASS